MADPRDTLDLWDYRRRVAAIYGGVRAASAPAAGWREWRLARDDLFATHPQSALDAEQRHRFTGLQYFPYDPRWRFEAPVEALDGDAVELGHSGPGRTAFRRFGRVTLDIDGHPVPLVLYWLDTYGGGLFLPFRDTSNGAETYGGGRYLLDAAKGADLGHDGDRVVLDFNFAYHPSCFHSHAWSCPLAPPDNRIEQAVRAGERTGD